MAGATYLSVGRQGRPFRWRKHRETVGVSDDALQTVLGKDDCETEVFVETIQRREHFLRTPRIELARRLVEGQDRGLQSKGGGDRHALPLPTRERRNLAISQCGDPQQIEHLLDPLAHRHRGHTELLHPEGELVVDAAGHELGLWILENERETGQDAWTVVTRVVAGDGHHSVECAALKCGVSPLRQRSSVDLPLPEGPVTVTNSPGTTQVNSRRAGVSRSGYR